jgi:DNA-binding transcriptional MerR regulator
MSNAFSIGQLAKQTGVAVETVRYTEKSGLLPLPSRTAGNYRSYGNDSLQRLSFVRRARDLGFPLEQIRALLGLADNVDRSCSEVDAITLAQLEMRKSPTSRPSEANSTACSASANGEPSPTAESWKLSARVRRNEPDHADRNGRYALDTLLMKRSGAVLA